MTGVQTCALPIFVRHVHERTGIWPWIYANPWLFNQGGVEKNCGRWAAQYPNIVRPSINHDPGKPPSVDGLLCAWQFASDGVVGGYSGNLDVDIFYGNREAWNKYAAKKPPVQPELPLTSTLENDEYKVTIERK